MQYSSFLYLRMHIKSIELFIIQWHCLSQNCASALSATSCSLTFSFVHWNLNKVHVDAAEPELPK